MQQKSRQWGVWVRINDRLGDRQSWLKSDDEIVWYATQRAAEAEARRLNVAMNGAYAEAVFWYEARIQPC